MIQVSDILADADRPERLEARYRAEPDAFARALQGACTERPESLVLQVWKQRLFFQAPAGAQRPDVPSLAFVIGLCGALALLVKLPEYSPIPDLWWYPRFTVPLVVLALIAYFLRRPAAQPIRPWVLGAAAVSFAGVSLLPPWPAAASDLARYPDSVVMALIHLPLLAISLAGIGFAGRDWRRLEPRMDFLRYGGELVVLTSLILLGGIVMTLLTFALFSLLELDIAEEYMR